MIIESDDNLARVGVIFGLLERAVKLQSQLGPIELSLAATSRTRASVINDILYDIAENELPGDGDITVGSMKGHRHFVLPNCLVRVHWSSPKSLIITTNRTSQTEDWECSNRQAALLTGFDPDSRFWLPYGLDETYSQIVRAGIGLYRGGKPIELREIDISTLESAGGSVEPIIPTVTRRPLTLKPSAQQSILKDIVDGTDT